MWIVSNNRGKILANIFMMTSYLWSNEEIKIEGQIFINKKISETMKIASFGFLSQINGAGSLNPLSNEPFGLDNT